MQTFSLSGTLPTGTTGPAPAMQAWLPNEADRNGAAIIIFPGGGYAKHAEHEGKGYAEYFVARGYACFVAIYRVTPDVHPAMLEDALAAVYAVRSRAAELGIDPDKIGVMGSSAGGHLAAHCLTASGTYSADLPLAPNFGILCYPVISMLGEHRHTGSAHNLHGGEPTPEQVAATSPELLASPQTPPCFIWHTREDQGVPSMNSLLFAQALERAGVSYELHIYKEGPHGLGLNTEYDWGGACTKWLGKILA
ncbi:alpha/beta hydrolase [Ruficoccus amylovorans]|uniref:Alpha/beta hydrolase n=1 Tax=Ruficoccus amylovorans TaxID=1804625 RepID=A0A842HCB0_9BACT|nr:alpha/beta hydrolase [Ruficoccus amylovorans]MBC2593041.1 alpha/beta hydrolase [Ruficoccus amylovorans]